MLNIEYIDLEKENSKVIDFVPDNLKDIPVMRALLENKFMIENPAKTFAAKIKSGEYDDLPDEDVVAEAEIANELSEMWGNNSEINVMMLVTKLINKYVIPEALNEQSERIRRQKRRQDDGRQRNGMQGNEG